MTPFSLFKLFSGKVGGQYLWIKNILVVHPLYEIRNRIASELEKKGYYVSAATNGHDGMFAGYSEKFALIISAMNLPRITGFEMIRTLQTHPSNNNNTPIIFIGTGHEDAETVAIASKLNAVIMPLSAISNSISKVDEYAPFADLLSWVKIDRTDGRPS